MWGTSQQLQIIPNHHPPHPHHHQPLFLHKGNISLESSLVDLHYISLQFWHWLEPFHLLVHVDISQVFLNVHGSETAVIAQLTFDTHNQVLSVNMSTALGELCYWVGAARMHTLIDWLAFCTSPLWNALFGYTGLMQVDCSGQDHCCSGLEFTLVWPLGQPFPSFSRRKVGFSLCSSCFFAGQAFSQLCIQFILHKFMFNSLEILSLLNTLLALWVPIRVLDECEKVPTYHPCQCYMFHILRASIFKLITVFSRWSANSSTRLAWNRSNIIRVTNQWYFNK